MLNANKPTQFYHFIMRTNHFNLEKVLTSNILVIYLYKQYVFTYTVSCIESNISYLFTVTKVTLLQVSKVEILFNYSFVTKKRYK